MCPGAHLSLSLGQVAVGSNLYGIVLIYVVSLKAYLVFVLDESVFLTLDNELYGYSIWSLNWS